MGGKVAVCFRHEDDTTDCRWVWTNATPFWFTHPDLMRCPEKHIQAYLAPSGYAEFCNDNGDSPLLPRSIAPESYGLVVIDVTSKKLMHMQGYTAYGEIYIPGLLMEYDSCIDGPWRMYGAPPGTPASESERIRSKKIRSKWFRETTDLWRLKQFVDMGCCITVKRFASRTTVHGANSKRWFDQSLGDWIGKQNYTFKDVFLFLQEKAAAGSKPLTFDLSSSLVVDMSPWKVKRFSESLCGSKSLRKTLKAMEFPVDDESWDKFDRSHFEEN